MEGVQQENSRAMTFSSSVDDTNNTAKIEITINDLKQFRIHSSEHDFYDFCRPISNFPEWLWLRGGVISDIDSENNIWKSDLDVVSDWTLPSILYYWSACMFHKQMRKS